MSSVEADLSNPTATLLTIAQVDQMIVNAQRVLSGFEAQARMKKVARRERVASDEEPEKVEWDHSDPRVIRLPEARQHLEIDFIPHEAHVQTEEE